MASTLRRAATSRRLCAEMRATRAGQRCCARWCSHVRGSRRPCRATDTAPSTCSTSLLLVLLLLLYSILGFSAVHSLDIVTLRTREGAKVLSLVLWRDTSETLPRHWRHSPGPLARPVDRLPLLDVPLGHGRLPRRHRPAAGLSLAPRPAPPPHSAAAPRPTRAPATLPCLAPSVARSE